MTMFVTDWTITSDLTDHTAHRVAEKWPNSWRLSWLPDRLLTREQALAGMDLAEIISTRTHRLDQTAQLRAVHLAGQLGIPFEQIMLGL
ncbi:hypothetical protein [Nocardia puris]|uniref:Uncharacterized protein n=1 Tax=Nocardia puris TaxID=208602 RepID=A0A366DX53_9NOCA|nr:hypothetical protein [Nocardia puris]RBO94109.1 hypothetical protein DFR74_102531 [Nocardia puris]